MARNADGLPNNIVTALALSAAGGMWLGTTDGLIRLTPEDVAAFDFGATRRSSLDDGLPSGRVLSLAVDGDDRIWVGTDAGLTIIEEASIETFTKNDGLPDDSVRDIAIAPDGSVWVATPSGVSVLR